MNKSSPKSSCPESFISKSIVIVGGGASATLLLAQLSIQLNSSDSKSIHITVIDDGDTCGGIAYQAQHPAFLLNVPADQMGAYQDKPDDFYQWLKTHPILWRNLHDNFDAIDLKPNDFVPRMIYGAYLKWVFEQAVNVASERNIFINRLKAKVTKVEAAANVHQLIVKTNFHDTLVADTLIFATGNTARKHQDVINPHIFLSPYCERITQEDWSYLKDTTIVGSGLSMVDAIQYLEQQGYTGKIQVFSRHGLIPLPHLTEHSPEAPDFSVTGLDTARKIVRTLREQIKINLAKGISWQKTINAFRKQVPTLWLALSCSEQQKIKRFLPWWNIARHRIPVEIYAQLMKLKNEGRLIIAKGDVKKAHSNGEYFLLETVTKTLFIKSERLIICSGYNGNYDNLVNLCDDLIPCKNQLKEIFSHNKLSLSNQYSIYAIGPTLTDILLETTAIHEIRQQSAIIASQIIQEQPSVNDQPKVKIS